MVAELVDKQAEDLALGVVGQSGFVGQRDRHPATFLAPTSVCALIVERVRTLGPD
jgi:hypothetical protein